MAQPPLTPEQAAQVDAQLARCERYLDNLAKRLSRVAPVGHQVRGWAEKSAWNVGGLRHHFAEWANGDRQCIESAGHAMKASEDRRASDGGIIGPMPAPGYHS